MIAVTGVPRTGTSFMRKFFFYCGERMIPKRCSPKVWDGKFNPDEPIELAKCVSQNEYFKIPIVLNEIETYWKDQTTDEIVIKHPYLAFFPEICSNYFSTTIITIDDISNRWIQSALAHNCQRWIKDQRIQILDKVDPEISINEGLIVIGNIWREKCFNLFDFLRKNEKTVFVWKFGDKDGFISIAKYFNLSKDDAITYWQNEWRGSRFASTV